MNQHVKNARSFGFNTFLGSFCRCAFCAVRRSLFRLQDHHTQRRQSNPSARRLAVRGFILSLHPSAVAHVAAAEHLRVAVENFAVSAEARKTDPVACPRHRREVAAEHQKVFAILRVARETNHARFGVAEVDPLKAAKIVVHLVQRRLRAIQAIQLPHHGLKLVVHRKLQQPPRQTLVVIPFRRSARIPCP